MRVGESRLVGRNRQALNHGPLAVRDLGDPPADGEEHVLARRVPSRRYGRDELRQLATIRIRSQSTSRGVECGGEMGREMG